MKTQALYTDIKADMVIACDKVTKLRQDLLCSLEDAPGAQSGTSETYASLALAALSQAQNFFRLAANFCNK